MEQKLKQRLLEAASSFFHKRYENNLQPKEMNTYYIIESLKNKGRKAWKIIKLLNCTLRGMNRR